MLSLFLVFYKKEISIPCDQNTIPSQLIEILKEDFPGFTGKEMSLVFIFNQVPRMDDIDTIEKLSAKFKDRLSIGTIFGKSFKYEKTMLFDYKIHNHLKIRCTSNDFNIESNFYLILKNNRIHHIDKNINISAMALLLQKYIAPGLKYEDLAVSAEVLKHKITERLKKGDIKLLNLNSGSETLIKDLSDLSKVYFIHAACSPCQLKSMLSQLNLKQIMDTSGKQIVIFSVFGESSGLVPIMEESKLSLPVYIDIKDEFNLFSTISNDKENPIVIDVTSI